MIQSDTIYKNTHKRVLWCGAVILIAVNQRFTVAYFIMYNICIYCLSIQKNQNYYPTNRGGQWSVSHYYTNYTETKFSILHKIELGSCDNQTTMVYLALYMPDCMLALLLYLDQKKILDKMTRKCCIRFGTNCDIICLGCYVSCLLGFKLSKQC